VQVGKLYEVDGIDAIPIYYHVMACHHCCAVLCRNVCCAVTCCVVLCRSEGFMSPLPLLPS
jgi:hypothetical protein